MGTNGLVAGLETAPRASAAFLEMRGITKRFPGVTALTDVSLEVRQGEVHGLVGENGAGKSTLIKILAGAYPADAGEIVIAGETLGRPNPPDMIRRGVAVIYQELMLAPHLTVAENLSIGRLEGVRLVIV
jgi:ribose transport system ATP-binding protein